MIRGAIEVASRSVVSGWLYSPSIKLRGNIVLAFIDARHIGTGRIELFRKDLKEAGLGDGFAGFHFPIRLAEDDEPGRITIRLEASDLCLLQHDAGVHNRQEAS